MAKQAIEKRINTWRKVELEVFDVELEIQRINNSSDYDKYSESTQNLLQKLNDKQLELIWEAQSPKERLDSRRKNLTSLSKRKKFEDGLYSYEIAVVKYAEVLYDLLTKGQADFVGHPCVHKLELYREIIQRELDGLLNQRTAIELLEKSKIERFIDQMEALSEKEPLNEIGKLKLQALKYAFHNVHRSKRDQVEFF